MAKRPSKTSSQTAAGETIRSDQGDAIEPASATGIPLEDAGSQNSEAGTAAGAAAATEGAAPAVPTPSASGESEAGGANSTDTREQSDQGGGGNAAAPAEVPQLDLGTVLTGKSSEILTAMSADDIRLQYPNFAAAVEAYAVAHDAHPSGLRITCRVDGFRRAGTAHPKGTVEHPFDAFPELQQVEQLLAEPKLVVELI